jgi:hypothetical protein
LIANNVQILNKEVDFLFTTEDVKKIKKFAHQKQGVSKLLALYKHIFFEKKGV